MFRLRVCEAPKWFPVVLQEEAKTAPIAFGIWLGRELKRAPVTEISAASGRKERINNTPVLCCLLTSAL